MTDTLELVDLDLLEAIFASEHCESSHSDWENQTCSHQVVAVVYYMCDSPMRACVKQAEYVRKCQADPDDQCADCWRPCSDCWSLVPV